MRALITGGHGFVGRHLAQHLVGCGDDVAVTYRPSGNKDSGGAVPLPGATQSFALDVTDRQAVDQLLSLLKPDVVYHLAALTFVPDAEQNPSRAFDVNLQGTMNILDSAASHCPDARLLFASSSEVYGEPRLGSLPLTEASELRPVSAYGLSKACADLAVFRASVSKGLYTIRVRAFPHIGPGQSEHFALSSFARQIASVKLGLLPPEIKVGNLTARRDFCDVSDVVRGYREALLNGKRGEAYNLCSGASMQIGDLLQILISCAGIDVEVSEDPARVRAIDVPDMFGSSDKAARDFGWRPRVEREAMLDSLLAYWLDRLSS